MEEGGDTWTSLDLDQGIMLRANDINNELVLIVSECPTNYRSGGSRP